LENAFVCTACDRVTFEELTMAVFLLEAILHLQKSVEFLQTLVVKLGVDMAS
jgi:hypothetical protein